MDGKEFSVNSSPCAYVQPVASHGQYPERLLVRDQSGTWHLWFGDGQEMCALSIELASWILGRPEMTRIPAPHYWFDVESLPVAVETYDSEWSVAD
jgi:hypothetical protein